MNGVWDENAARQAGWLEQLARGACAERVIKREELLLQERLAADDSVECWLARLRADAARLAVDGPAADRALREAVALLAKVAAMAAIEEW